MADGPRGYEPDAFVWPTDYVPFKSADGITQVVPPPKGYKWVVERLSPARFMVRLVRERVTNGT